MRRALIVGLVASAGCVRAGAYVCQADQDCTLGGLQGACEPVGYCAFPDPTCADGSRYGSQAGAFSDRCVTAGDGSDAGIDVPVVPGDYTIGGTISGLSGTGLVLQDNGGDDRAITSNGAFTFATAVHTGNPYAVTVKTPPSGQTVTLVDATGVVAGAAVTTVGVLCGVVLLEDTFETGTLAWTVSGPGSPWAISTADPFAGTQHARVVPSSTTDPASVMTRAVPTTAHAQISVGYERKLLGLDSADEFRAQWFDGATWIPLEVTGTAAANDAAYVAKVFQLPSSADDNAGFQLRFECTAGAVSESCNVDNVVVIAGQ